MGSRSATIVAASAAFLFSAGEASAATFVVTKEADTNAACNVGNCSLREAVKAANANAGPDTIVVPPGQYTLTGAAGEDAAETGDLDITEANAALLIEGAGSSGGGTTISGGGIDRVFDVIDSAQLELRNVRLTGGKEAGGGAIRNHDGDLRIRDSVLESNSASTGGAIYSFGIGRPRVAVEASTLIGNTATANGGAIRNEGDSRLVVTNSTLTGNHAPGSRGGALFSQNAATATIVDSTVSGNTATGEGGGLGTQNDSSLTVVRSTISSNQSLTEQAGGIWAQNSSTVAIVDSTLTGNKSLGTDGNDGGGAIWAQNDVALAVSGSTFSGNFAARHGGAIYVRNFVWLTMQNSTVAGNIAEQSGGGLYAEQSPVVQVTHSTIASNSASAGSGVFDGTAGATPRFHLRGTIVAANTAAGSPNDCDGAVAGGAYASFGFNLDGTGTCDLNASGDTPNGNAALGPLADNGGPTDTIALQAGSQAIDAGGTACPASDQRGAPRPQGAACDIGAVEASPSSIVVQPEADTTAPRARLLGKKTLKLGKRIVLRVRCNGTETCITGATGALRIKGLKKALRLTPSKRIQIAAGKTAKLTLRVPKKARSRARAALRQGKWVRALITVRVGDRAGNERLLRRTLRLT